LISSLFYKDDLQKFSVADLAGNNANSGFVKRRTFIRASQQLEMIGRIHADVFFQDRYLINQGNVKLRFIRSRDSFSLIEADENRIIIEDMVLYVRMVKFSAAMILSHVKKFDVDAGLTTKYPVRRVVCKAVAVLQGLLDATHEKLFSGQLPNRIIVGMVRNEAFLGYPEHNPYNFQHFNLKEISVFADGQNV